MELPANQNKMISSREIAEITGKQHKTVLRDCDKLNEHYETLGMHKIVQGYYCLESTGNQRHREMQLTKMQSMDLMTGYKVELRIKVNRRWEELENEKHFKPLTQLEILAQSTQILIEQDKRIDNLESAVNKIVAQTKTTPDYFTVVGYATLRGIACPLPVASKMGRAASRICKDNNIPTDEIPDPRFGRVKTYPLYILENVFQNVPIN